MSAVCTCVYPPDYVTVCALHPWGHSDASPLSPCPGAAHLPAISPLLYVGNKRAAAERAGGYDVVVSTTVPVDAAGREDVAGALSTHVLLYEDTEEASHADTARRQIADGARLVADAVAAGKTVLVHCEWGQNRSCSICCAFAVLYADTGAGATGGEEGGAGREAGEGAGAESGGAESGGAEGGSSGGGCGGSGGGGSGSGGGGWTAAAAVAYCRERNQADRSYRGQEPPNGGAMHNQVFVGFVEELERERDEKAGGEAKA